MSSTASDGQTLTLKQQSFIEAIGRMEESHGHAHVSELAREAGISKPSVVQMIARLAKAGAVRKAGVEIRLTAAGRRAVRLLGGRQAILQAFMIEDLGMDPGAAAVEACRLEHAVSTSFIGKLRGFRLKRNGMQGKSQQQRGAREFRERRNTKQKR